MTKEKQSMKRKPRRRTMQMKLNVLVIGNILAVAVGLMAISYYIFCQRVDDNYNTSLEGGEVAGAGHVLGVAAVGRCVGELGGGQAGADRGLDQGPERAHDDAADGDAVFGDSGEEGFEEGHGVRFFRWFRLFRWNRCRQAGNKKAGRVARLVARWGVLSLRRRRRSRCRCRGGPCLPGGRGGRRGRRGGR